MLISPGAIQGILPSIINAFAVFLATIFISSCSTVYPGDDLREKAGGGCSSPPVSSRGSGVLGKVSGRRRGCCASEGTTPRLGPAWAAADGGVGLFNVTA